MCAGCEDELQREAALEGEALNERAGAIEPYLASLSGRGQPLPEATRAYMEPRFGVDFSQVRVHTDGAAAESARAVDALAFTVGRDIVFGAGRYAPESGPGRKLLAHELTHVTQQGEGRAFSGFMMRQPDDEEPAPAEEGPGFWGTIAGGLMGEFEEDPSFAMIGVDLGVSLIPILDQASDARDIIAHLYYMTVRGQYNRFMRWIGLVFSLIGLFPEVGSAIKSASKFVIRGVREVLSRIADLLRPLRAVLPEIGDIGRFQRYVATHWNRFVEFGTEAWNRAVTRGSEIAARIPEFLGAARRRAGEAFARIRELTPTRLAEAFAWARRKFDEVLDQVRERLGLREGLGPPPAGAAETRLSQAEYEAALARTFPGHYLDTLTRTMDDVGERAAQDAVSNPRFVQAVQAGNWTLAGTFFHTAARDQVRALPTSALPPGWVVEAERTIQAGAGGSRADVLLRGPAGEILEFDWKTTGRSALSHGSRTEMTRHAGQIVANIGGTLVTQQSRSWIDFVRPLMPGTAWP